MEARGIGADSERILVKTEMGNAVVYLPTASSPLKVGGVALSTCRETTKPVLVDGLEQDV